MQRAHRAGQGGRGVEGALSWSGGGGVEGAQSWSGGEGCRGCTGLGQRRVPTDSQADLQPGKAYSCHTDTDTFAPCSHLRPKPLAPMLPHHLP